MEVEGVTVQKIIEPKLLGVHNAHNVWFCHGKYGEYLRYNSLNYSIPAWAKMENLNEPFGIAYATKIPQGSYPWTDDGDGWVLGDPPSVIRNGWYGWSNPPIRHADRMV